jgi:hypothetical protein
MPRTKDNPREGRALVEGTVGGEFGVVVGADGFVDLLGLFDVFLGLRERVLMRRRERRAREERRRT